MTIYQCADDGGYILEIEADSAEAAAQEYVDGGDYDVGDSTLYVDVTVQYDDDEEWITIPVHPREPECTELEHDWHAPHDIVGGLEDNPGVFGHGGGVVIYTVCRHCGIGREENTWAQHPQTGQQGLESVTYSVGEWS